LDNLDDYKIYTAADVLKVWLRELPSPLLGYDFYTNVTTELYQIVRFFSLQLRFSPSVFIFYAQAFFLRVWKLTLRKIDDQPQEWLEQLRNLVCGLPVISYALMKYLARHLWHVAQENEQNLMGVSNLSIVFGNFFPELIFGKFYFWMVFIDFSAVSVTTQKGNGRICNVPSENISGGGSDDHQFRIHL
jgi:hypothetical protein